MARYGETLPLFCSCGYPEGSFACKIRHINMNTGDAKAANDLAKAPDRTSAAARRQGIRAERL